MTKFLYAGQSMDYPTLGFRVTADGAVLDGTLSTPAIETPPDARWSVYGGEAGETDITRYGNPVVEPGPAEPTDGAVLVYDAFQNAYVPGDPLATYATVADATDAGGSSWMHPSELKKFRAAVAKVRMGTADARVLCLGDSIIRGTGSSDSASVPKTGWPPRLAALLNTYHVPAANGLGIPVHAFGSTTDSRWNLGTSWAKQAFGFGGLASYSRATGTPADLLTFTPGATMGTFDTFDVWFTANGTASSVQVIATGGSAVNRTFTTGEFGAFKVTCTASAAGTGNAVTVSNTGGATVRVIGVEPYLAGTKKVRIGNAGIGGSTTVNWVTDPSNSNASLFTIKGLAPDLSIICLGTNDAYDNAQTAAFKTNLGLIVDAALVSGDVILMTPPPGNDVSGVFLANRPTIITAIKDTARERGLSLIDIDGRWVTQAANVPFGYYFDSLHPLDLGYQDMAGAVAGALRAVG